MISRPSDESAAQAAAPSPAPLQALPGAPGKPGAVELVGRLWNVLVVCATFALCAYGVHYVFALPQDQGRGVPALALTLVVVIPYFLALRENVWVRPGQKAR